MESIFHEKQEGYLCAQHCLNALLQGQYFNAVDLANLAEQLDIEERRAMAESGEDTDDYKRFIEQPSGNMDDSGYFSVQVISSALKVWNLELIPYTSTEPAALIAQNDPSEMKAYICNYKGHWFTIRKLGKQWFNLNSTLSGPHLISDTYLALFLTQLIQEGYSIFIVIGNFPPCEADEILLKNPVEQTRQKPVTEQSKFPSKGYRLGTKAEDEVKILEAAKAMESVKVPTTSRINRQSEVEIISEIRRQPRERIIPIQIEGREEVHTIEDDDEENAQLQRALALSLENYEAEQQKKDQLRLDDSLASTSNCSAAPTASVAIGEDDEDDDLRKALQLSLECVTAPQTPDQEDLRWHRLAYLGLHSRGQQTESSTKLNT
ncbi:ataxin-3 [Copidosoma floridanum]|uniref:ataxin-3 n=1 Tax=Copidosoma floridanum TaxID=29053 RepID=UPI0006C9BD10|nr:ataxin-3 [Copidosoma floridanum]XP_023245869.1 ataxin-3 [Copidosoma floridanum]